MHRKIFFIILCSVVVLAVGLAFFQWFFTHPPSPPTHPREELPSPHSKIGETTAEELRTRPDIISEEQIDEDAIRFEFESGVPLRPDTIFTKDGVVEYEAHTVDVDDYTTSSYPTLSEYFSEYGSAPLLIQGSWRYGPFAQTYAYPALGLSLVGNPTTDEVLEVEFFIPVSPEEYSDTYGKNIQHTGSPVHESERL